MISTVTGVFVLIVVVLAAGRRALRARESAAWSRRPPVIALVALPMLIGTAPFDSRPATVAIWALAALMAFARSHDPASRWRWTPTSGLLVAWCIPMLIAPHRSVLLLGAGILTLLLLVASKRTLDEIVPSLVDGIGVYLIANVVAHALGLQSALAAQRVAGLDSSLGGERVFYPFAIALGVPPLMAAVFVGAFVAGFGGRGWRLLLRLVALVCAIEILISANTRAAVLIAVVVAVLTLLSPALLSRMAVPSSAVVLSIAFIYPFIVDPIVRPLVSKLVGAVPFLSRGSEATDVSFAGRDLIWQLGLQHWSAHVQLGTGLFGWGLQGTRTSGASAVYGPSFPGLTSDPLSLSVHNSAFQQLYDSGVVGLAALAIAWIVTLRALGRGVRQGSQVHLIGLAMTVAALWSGGTEVTVATGPAQEPFWVVATMVLALSRTHPDASREDPGRSGAPATAAASSPPGTAHYR